MSMTIDQAIAKAFLHAQRKATPPANGTPKYNALLGIADSMTKLWATEPDTEWDTLYSLVTLSSVVSATNVFALDATINDISEREGDAIRVTNGTNTTAFSVVSPNQLYEYRYQNAVARIGSNLKFSQAFASTSPLIGYSIQVPAILYTTDVTSGSQTVQVDDPMYLVYMMAAEFVRNDPVRVGQYNNLLALAEQTMQKMKETNGGQMDAISTPWTPAGQSWC
jgi:hypothetical protein